MFAVHMQLRTCTGASTSGRTAPLGAPAAAARHACGGRRSRRSGPTRRTRCLALARQCPAPVCAPYRTALTFNVRAEAGAARSTGFGLAEAVGAAAAASPDTPPAAAPLDPPAAAEPRELAEDAAPADDDLLELGVFGAPHGLGGELRLALITDAPEQRLGAPGRLWVRPRTGWTRERGRGPPQPVRPLGLLALGGG